MKAVCEQCDSQARALGLCKRHYDKKRYAEIREQQIAKAKEWSAKNPDRRREISAKYTVKNREKTRAAVRASQKKNPERKRKWNEANIKKRRDIRRRWNAKNAEWLAANRRLRRAMEVGASGRHYADEIKALLKMQRGKCAYCRRDITTNYHADHVIPLARGGSNDIENIQLLCPDCNLRKSDKDPIRFAQENGRLL